MGAGNPLYFDMEAYNRTTTNTSAVLAFLAAWTAQLHASGYLSGVYSSDASGISDLVAQQGTGYVEPDELWIANWNGSQSTADADVPAQYWAAHQRLHQYQGAHNETYGGAKINIDGDYLDSATAAAGTGSGVDAAPAVAADAVAAGDRRPRREHRPDADLDRRHRRRRLAGAGRVQPHHASPGPARGSPPARTCPR